jgi:hypothetical protein
VPAKKGNVFTCCMLTYHVIPEGAERLSGIQEENKTFLDSGSRLRLARCDAWCHLWISYILLVTV